MDFIYDLLDDLYAELEEAQQNLSRMDKGMTRECLDDIDKLSHAAKSLETIIAMKSGGNSYRENYREGRRSYNDGYSGYGGYGGYRESYQDQDYGARRRDSMGRYRARYRDRYSDGEKESLRNQLNQMLSQAKDEKEREAYKLILKKMED